MKKIISILLAVMLVVFAAVPVSAVSYTYTDSYTVDAGTPTCLEALEASRTADPAWDGNYCTIYFQAPEEWYNQYNTLEGTDYGQICAYWWTGPGSKWPDGSGIQWVGYKCDLIDKESRIFAAQVPADTDQTAMMIFNNGINGGAEGDPMRQYCAQIKDTYIYGAEEDEFDTMPEGSPNPDDFDGCICVPDPARTQINEFSGVLESYINWYVYYGDGHYGSYAPTSDHFKGVAAECKNPMHHHADRGDPNNDKSIDVLDAEIIQRYLVKKLAAGEVFDELAADVDADGIVSVIDATRIQRVVAGLCDIDGKKLA